MSTVSWGSAFPTTWPRKRIKYLCRFAGGGTPDKGNPEYWNGEIPWVSPKDMKSATVDDTEDHITTDGLESSAAKLVAPGAVLLVMRSGILRHSIPVAINRVSIALNQDMRALIPFPQVEARFLARLLEGHQQQLLNVWSKVGSTVESLESDLVGETEIAVPVLDQQRAIADYLDRETARLDALVAAKKRVLGLLAEKRRSLITRAVTRGLDPHAPLRDSGIPWLGEIPAHWEQCHLKRVLVGVDYGVSIAVDTEGAIAVLRMGDLRDGDLDYSGVGFVEKVDEVRCFSSEAIWYSIERIASIRLARSHCFVARQSIRSLSLPTWSGSVAVPRFSLSSSTTSSTHRFPKHGAEPRHYPLLGRRILTRIASAISPLPCHRSQSRGKSSGTSHAPLPVCRTCEPRRSRRSRSSRNVAPHSLPRL